jgi:cytochrome bd ubiquinol oxidase subunit I
MRVDRLIRPDSVSGIVVFTVLGFAGLYLLLGMLFVIQVLKEIDRGPAASH